MTTNEKINEILAMISHLNYKLNNDSRDRQYVEEWIEELKEEIVRGDPIHLEFSATAIKDVVLRELCKN